MQQANVRQCSYFELALPVDLHAEIQDNKGPDLIINFTEYYGEVGGGGAYYRDALFDHFWCQPNVMYWKIFLWVVIRSALRETQTAKILDCVHVHGRSIEEKKKR